MRTIRYLGTNIFSATVTGKVIYISQAPHIRLNDKYIDIKII